MTTSHVFLCAFSMSHQISNKRRREVERLFPKIAATSAA